MINSTWYVPLDELSEYDKMRFRTIDKKIPLYFLPRTELVDSINVTNPFVKNAQIGYTVIKQDGDLIYHDFCIDETSAMGQLALKMMKDIDDHGLTNTQFYINTTLYAEKLMAILSIKVGILGEVQEDYFSIYFTGKSIRDYSINETNTTETKSKVDILKDKILSIFKKKEAIHEDKSNEADIDK